MTHRPTHDVSDDDLLARFSGNLDDAICNTSGAVRLKNEGPMKAEVAGRLIELREDYYTLSISIEHCPDLREDHGRRFLRNWNPRTKAFSFSTPRSEYEGLSSRVRRAHLENERVRRVVEILRDHVPALAAEAGEIYEQLAGSRRP